MNNLIGNDILLMRKRYNEALKLQGVKCLYQFPNLATSNAQGESVIDSYSIPEETYIFFEGSPKIKTFKRYGWVVENDKDLPFLIHCSFDLEQVQRDSIFKINGQYTGLPDRTFKVTEISYDIQAPDHIVCQVIPVYENQTVGRTKKEITQTFNRSEHFIKQPTDYRGQYITDSTRYRRTGEPSSFLANVIGTSQGGVMLNINKSSDIQITRGDNACMQIDIRHQDGSPYERVDGDQLVFTVKKSYKSDYEYLEKSIDGLALILKPEDTKEMDYGSYWYDVELTTADGAVFTVVGPARFVVREEVTFL